MIEIADLFRGDKSAGPSRHAVIIYFQYGHEELDPLHELESRLRVLLFHNNVGELDGHEIAMDSTDGYLYLYGNNAEELFKAVRPALLETPFMRKAEVYLRFGAANDVNAKEIDFMLE